MKILKKEVLADTLNTRLIRIEVESAEISSRARPGQFVVLIVNEKGERIPLTVVSADKAKKAITIIFQEAGLSTRLLGKLEAGDSLYALTGPLGHATEIQKYGKVFMVGGGVGIAEVYPVAKAMKDAGNYVVSILGARTKGLLILEDELKAASSEVHIATDDGSYGRKGFVTDILWQLLTENRTPKTENLVYAVGPIPMMKKVSEVTKGFGVKTVVSLNTLMVDATGMCGCCRVTIGGSVKFSCVDGPEFDGHEVDWDELEKRSKIYECKEEHICRLNKNQ